MKKIITCYVEPTPELQTEQGISSYSSKLMELSLQDLCIELSNVLAAKKNHMLFPSFGNTKTYGRQEIVTDLTDKTLLICICGLGKDITFGLANGDLVSLNKMINDLDEKIAERNLEPEQHGMEVFTALNKIHQSRAKKPVTA